MFDFLTNIYDKAKSALSSVFQPSSNVAGVGASFSQPKISTTQPKVSQPVNQSVDPYVPMTVAPNMSTAVGPARGNMDGTITFNTPKGAINVKNSDVPTYSSISTPYIPGVTATAPVKSVVRQAQTPTVSTSSGGYNSDWFTASGIPLASKAGVPIHGELGTSGTGSFSSQNGGMPSFSPSASTPGTSGFGGFSIGSSPLGYFNAQSSGFGDTSQQTDQQLTSKLKYNPATGRLEPSLNPDGTPTFNQADVNALGKTSPIPVINPTGGKTVQNQGIVIQPSISDRLTNTLLESTLGDVSVPNIMSSTDLQKAISDTQAYLNAPGAKSPADLQQIQNNFKQILDIGVENYLKQKGMTPDTNIVEDSPELQDFFSKLSGNDKFDYQQFADDFRTKSGMSSYLKMKESAIAAIDVATQEFNKFVKDVRDNPDLPSGLAAKRMSAFKDQIYSPAIEQAKAMLDQSANAINDINSALNSQLGIVSAQRSDNQRIMQNNLDVFKTLVSAGADFTQEEKNSWAQKLGLSPGALNSLTKKLSTADTYITTDNGVTKAIDKVTGKTVWQNGTATSKSTVSSSGTGNSQIDSDLMKVLGGAGSVYEKQLAQDYVKQKVASGDIQGAQSYIDSLAIRGLPTAQRQQFINTGVFRNDVQAALDGISQIQSSNPGLYKNLANSAAPFLVVNPDQNFIAAKALVDGFQAQKINDLYGAALTGGELARANNFFVDFSKDNIATIKTKLNGLLSTANRQRSSLLGEANFQFDSNGNTITPQSSTQQQPQNDSAIFNSVVSGTGTTGNSQGGGFSQFLGDLWKNITGG